MTSLLPDIVFDWSAVGEQCGKMKTLKDFEEEINKVLAVLPRERRTFLFSATMTSKVAKLQRASLKDPARVRTP